jgi:metal-responsive CopG/Arc/MetJ family transcriptional regulator
MKIPAWLLYRVDEIAAGRGLSRSALIRGWISKSLARPPSRKAGKRPA